MILPIIFTNKLSEIIPYPEIIRLGIVGQYVDYNKLLRNWFVVFWASIIGAIALDKGFFATICISQKITIIRCIFIAIFSQVIASLVNKWRNYAKDNPYNNIKYNWLKKSLDMITSKRFMLIINILADVVTALLYLIAALKIAF